MNVFPSDAISVARSYRHCCAISGTAQRLVSQVTAAALDHTEGVTSLHSLRHGPLPRTVPRTLDLCPDAAVRF